MNEYDSDRMLDVLREACGMKETGVAEEAGLLLLNTCSIREKAQEKVFSQLGRWRALKERDPAVKIGVCGCVASQEGEALRRRAPWVDIVFGPQTVHRLPQLLKASQRKPAVDVSFPEIEKFDSLPKPENKGVTAFVSIMEGCSKYCSFCIVPYTRGTEFSRSVDDIVVEVSALAKTGTREVTLLGQNVNSWRNDKGMNFAVLLYHIAAIDGIERIRYTSPHPSDFDDELIASYADLPQLTNHVHLPVQSGCDRILALMKRGYTASEYRSIVRKLREIRPDISISSDFIVGFPGESDEDFEQTIRLVEHVSFDQSFSFIYSARPGTPASLLPDTTPLQVKKQRLARLQALLQKQTDAVSDNMVGTTQTVLVEGCSKKSVSEWSGRTSNNRVVNFAATGSPVGRALNLFIDRAMSNSLRGRPIETLSQVSG